MQKERAGTYKEFVSSKIFLKGRLNICMLNSLVVLMLHSGFVQLGYGLVIGFAVSIGFRLWMHFGSNCLNSLPR